MSIAELKATADRLNAEERKWLRAYLAALERTKDAGYLAEITRRNDELASGKGIAQEDVIRTVDEHDAGRRS